MAPTVQSGAPLPNGEVEQGAGGAEGTPSVEVSPPSAVAQSDSLEWLRETPRSLWTKIAGEARSYYHCQKFTEYVIRRAARHESYIIHTCTFSIIHVQYLDASFTLDEMLTCALF